MGIFIMKCDAIDDKELAGADLASKIGRTTLHLMGRYGCAYRVLQESTGASLLLAGTAGLEPRSQISSLKLLAA